MQSIRSFCLAALLALVPLSLVSAQMPYQVIDLDPSEPTEQGSTPRWMQQVGDLTFFFATTPGSGEEVWLSDGTPQGSRLLADINPGPGDSSPTFHGQLGDVIFFTGRGGDGFRQLWRSDGTEAGTFLLTALQSGNPIPSERTAMSDHGLFLAVGVSENIEGFLWFSDGTVAGTRLINNTMRSNGLQMASRGQDAVFLEFGGPFWTSDGTVAGTVIVTEWPSATLIDSSNIHVVGNAYYIFASDSPPAEQIWRYDGTLAKIADSFSFVRSVRSTDSGLYFFADGDVQQTSDLWFSDGTALGTRRLQTLGFGNFDLTGLDNEDIVEMGDDIITTGRPQNENQERLLRIDGTTSAVTILTPEARVFGPLIEVDGRIVFVGDDTERSRLWVSDGTLLGTNPVFDPCSNDDGCTLGFAGLTSGLDGVVFTVETAAQGVELWTSDGSVDGTRVLSNFSAPSPFPGFNTFAPWLVANDTTAVFAADGLALGEELWITRGTVASTQLAANIAQDAPASSVRYLAELDDQLLFTACDGQQTALWTTLGDAAGTLQLAVMAQDDCESEVSDFVVADGQVFFTVGEKDLWASDGTLAGTRRAYRLPGSCSYGDLRVAVGGKLLFVVFAPGPDQVWLSDGTDAGTGPLEPFVDFAVQGQDGYDMASTGKLAFVLIEDNDAGAAWLSTDGTVEGSVVLRQLDNFPTNPRMQAVEMAGETFVNLRTGPSAIWRTDGTAAGTFEAVAPGSNISSQLRDLTAFDDRLLLIERISTQEDGLVSFSPQTGETVILTRFPKVEVFFDPAPSAEMTRLGDRLFFVINDGVHGREVWSTDGTVPGTQLLVDLFPGSIPSQPTGLTVFGNHLYFAAGVTDGRELWTSDGTAPGTRQVADIASGLLSSAPEQLTPTSELLYFTADEGVSGRELWATTAAPASPCTPSDTVLCLGDGRFRATVTWTDFDNRQGNGRSNPLSNDTGAFWFFEPSNLELMVKVIDGRDFNGNFWVFYGALSNVAFELTVEDLVTGNSASYSNPIGTFASEGDTLALPAPPGAGTTAQGTTAVTANVGVGNPFELQLGDDGRFVANVTWTDFQGTDGVGTAVPLTDDTGAFWFFGANNLELMIKVIDGRDFNGNYWVFYGALSNVAFELTVTDTATGNVATYENPIDTFASRGDTAALPGTPQP